MSKFHISSIVCIILTFLFSFNFNVFADNNENENAILVKVGYSENNGIIKKPQFEGFEGYGYEYLHKISQYTDNNYEFEFIECNFTDGIEMLSKNEIQILAPLNYNINLGEEFVYSQQPISRNFMFLTSLNGQQINDDNLQIINNSKIAVKVYDSTNAFTINEFFYKKKLKAEIVYIENDDYTNDELIAEFDFLITDSMQMDLDFDFSYNLGVNDVFLVFNKNSKNIIQDFDNAMIKISQNEYLYKEQLAVKYFNHTINNHDHITNDDIDFLVNSGTFIVGVESLYDTYGIEQISTVAGLSYDVVNMLVEQTGMNVSFEKMNNYTVSQIIDNYDFYLKPIGYTYDGNKRLSEPYLSTPLIVIKNVQNNNLTGKTGVVSSYNLDYSIIDYLTPNQNVVTYSSVVDLYNAFKKQYIDYMLIAETEYNCGYTIIQDISHTIDTSNFMINGQIVFSDNFAQENIDTINKLITHINPADIEICNIKNASLLNIADKTNFFRSYWRAFLVLIIIIVVIYVKTNKNRDMFLEKLSAYDDLTDLFTQRKFIEETRKLLNDNPNKEYSIMLIDIDNFKYINEIYGYNTGSEILKKIANIIKNSIDKTYPVSRPSSDNFLLLVESNDLNNKIKNSYLKKDNPLYTEMNQYVSEHYSINFSIGTYAINDKSLEISYMIDCCKLAHSFSKRELGTYHNAFSEDMKVKETTKNSIIARMNQALLDKEFVIFYQPKFDIVTKEITGAEGLVRWFSDGVMVPPNDFIPLFEQNGFIEKLDYYVVERVCEFIKENPNSKLPVLSVNLSGITIMKSDVVDRIMEIVERHDIKPKQIDLEITESAFVDHFEMAIESIDKFRDLGFTISMDDFGAGISSLNRLKEISIDILKIDREFIVGSLKNEKGSTIIRNIVLMAKDLRLETVAEGIETEDQLNFLRNLGCDVGQGYLFSRPLPEQDFLKKLDE